MLLSLIVYANSLKNGFVWDDRAFIENSAFIKDWRNITKIFTPSYLSLSWKTLDVNRPFMVVSLMFDYRIWGLNPFGYHLTNILLHLANISLLYTLLKRLSINSVPARIGTLLFALHPIQSEVVNGINFREDLLIAFFLMLAAIFLIKFLTSHQSKHYIISLISFTMAALSKETAIAFLPLIFTYLYFFDKRISRRHCIGYIAVLLTYLIFLSVVYSHSDLPAKVKEINSCWSILLSTIRAISYYICMALFPINLSVAHNFSISGHIASADYLAFGALLTFSMYTLKTLRNNKPATLFLAFCFLMTLLPSIAVVYSYRLLIERFIYVPMIGFCGIVGMLSERLIAKRYGAIIITLFVILTINTINRNRVWENNSTLWSDAVKKSPHSGLAHYNLGSAFLEKGVYEGALSEFLESIKTRPDGEAYYGIGSIYLYKKEYNSSIYYLTASVKAGGAVERPEIYNKLGYAYAITGMYKEAIQAWSDYITLGHGNAETYTNLGSAYAKLSMREKAIEAYLKALKIDPNYIDALKYLRVIQSSSNTIPKESE